MKEKNLKITVVVFLSVFILLVLNGLLVYSLTGINAVEDEINTIPEYGNANLSEVSMAHTLKTESDMATNTLEDFIPYEITDVQFQVYTKYINNIKGVKQNSNRELTESEGLRKLKLRDQYIYDNIRPKNLLSFLESESELFLDLDNDFLHYPNRELTDEELLQLIDFEKKINYILSLNDEKVAPSIKDISKSEAVTKAIESVEKLFDVDTGKLEITASYFETGPAKRAIWLVRMAPYRMNSLRANKETFWEYAVFIDALAGDVIETKRSCSTYKFMSVDKDKIKDVLENEEWSNMAENIVIKKQRETRDIIYSKVVLEDSEGNKNSKRLIEYGFIDVHVALEDGSFYIATFLYPDKLLKDLSYVSNK